jgi:xylan 1,4-beta-xylosidase
MDGDRVQVESSGALPLDTILAAGVHGQPEVDAIATSSDREVSVLLWNYGDDDVQGPDAAVKLAVDGLLAEHRVLARHYRIDAHHSNAFTAWKEMGSPQNPSPEEYARLESAGKLEELTSPSWLGLDSGTEAIEFSLPRHAVSLIQLSW